MIQEHPPAIPEKKSEPESIEERFKESKVRNEDGALMRVKKETEKGIMTIQESKNHSSH